MTQKKREKQEWKPFLSLLKEAKLPWGWYCLNIVISLILSTIMMRMPQVAGQIMAGEIFDKKLLATYAAVMVGGSVMTLPLSLFTSWIRLRTDRNLRSIVWKKIIHIPMKEVDKLEPTSLVSRITTDTAEISYGIYYIFSMINMVYRLVMILVIVGGMNKKMLLMMSLVIPMIFLANIPSHFMYEARNETQGALANYTNFLAERLGFMKQIKAFNAEKRENEINEKASEAYFKGNIKMAKLNLFSQPLIYSMEAVIKGVILIYGGYLMNTGELDSAAVVSLFMYAENINIYAMQFVFFWQSAKKAQGAAKKASEIVAAEPEVMERKISFAIPDEDIRMENVAFAYGDGKRVLDGLNLTIPKGKITAIVGPSGSGKTTVLKLLERLYEPAEGTVWFGDADAADIHLNEWRASFGMVPQDSPLLFGTIKDNILYGVNTEVSDAELQSVISRSNVQEILDRMPDGLLTEVGDIGDRISGGERQRIALARMMVREPEYLLLDEATSALDAENEYQITEKLMEMMKGRTSVVVAHNLRTIEKADNIVFMENGKVKGCGTHEELCASNETYQRYVELQRA